MVPWCMTFPGHERGNWVYARTLDDKIIFGCIQGINLSGKAAMFGICPVGILDEIVWVPEWMIRTKPEAILEMTECFGSGYFEDAQRFVDHIESQDWVKKIR